MKFTTANAVVNCHEIPTGAISVSQSEEQNDEFCSHGRSGLHPATPAKNPLNLLWLLSNSPFRARICSSSKIALSLHFRLFSPQTSPWNGFVLSVNAQRINITDIHTPVACSLEFWQKTNFAQNSMRQDSVLGGSCLGFLDAHKTTATL